jgi:hypothetical protein
MRKIPAMRADFSLTDCLYLRWYLLSDQFIK